MNKEDIVFGLRNAVERGFSLQSAVQSFLNAGYNAVEVNEAAKQINMGVLGRMEQKIKPPVISSPVQIAKPSIQNNMDMEIPSPEQSLSVQKLPSQTEPPKKGLSPILIALIVFVVILVIGIVTFSLLGESLLNALFK